MKKLEKELRLLAKAGYLTKKEEKSIKKASPKELAELRSKFDYCFTQVCRVYKKL